MTTIEIPEFWTFVLPCGCLYGSMVADQHDVIIATPEHAWDEFYRGQKAKGNRDKKQGCTVRPHEEGDWFKLRDNTHLHAGHTISEDS